MSWSGFGSLMNKMLLHSKGIEDAPQLQGHIEQLTLREGQQREHTKHTHRAFRTEIRRAAAAHSSSYHVANQAASVGENASLGTAKTFCKQNNGSLRTVIYPGINTSRPSLWPSGAKEKGIQRNQNCDGYPTSLAIMIGE